MPSFPCLSLFVACVFWLPTVEFQSRTAEYCSLAAESCPELHNASCGKSNSVAPCWFLGNGRPTCFLFLVAFAIVEEKHLLEGKQSLVALEKVNVFFLKREFGGLVGVSWLNSYARFCLLLPQNFWLNKDSATSERKLSSEIMTIPLSTSLVNCWINC